MNPLLPSTLQRDWILASASPRRAEILRMLGFEFAVAPTSAEAEPLDEPEPLAHSRAQARRKAAAGARGRPAGSRRSVPQGATTPRRRRGAHE